MKKTAKTLSYDARVRIFWTLAGISIVSIGFYIYAVNAAVSNTLARNSLESEVADLSAKIGDRQFGLIAMQQKVDLPSAYAAGYTDAKDPLYISRVPALSMNTVRP